MRGNAVCVSPMPRRGFSIPPPGRWCSFPARASEALQKGLDIDTVAALPARERIGRLKYAPEEQAADEFTRCMAMLEEELRQALTALAESGE